MLWIKQVHISGYWQSAAIIGHYLSFMVAGNLIMSPFVSFVWHVLCVLVFIAGFISPLFFVLCK
jgi:hypothetical protein